MRVDIKVFGKVQGVFFRRLANKVEAEFWL